MTKQPLSSSRPFREAGVRTRNTGSLSLAGWAAVALVSGLYGAMIPIFAQGDPLVLVTPLLLLALSAIWLLPVAKRAPTRIITACFFAFYVSVLLWPDYLAISLPGLPWITLRRLSSAPLFLALLIALSVSPRFRGELKGVLEGSPLIWKLLAAFVGIQAVSIVWSANVGLSADKFVIAQLYWTMMFFVGCWIFSRQGGPHLWAALLCLTLVPLGLIGIWEFRLSQIPWANSIPSFLAIEDESVQRTLAGAMRSGTEIYRVQAIHGTSLGYAEYMALATPFLIHFIMGGYRPAVRVAAILLIPFTFYLIVITNSRLGVIGFMLSFVMYFFFWSVRRWRTEGGSLFGPAITLAYPALFALFVAATLFVGRLRRMFWGGGEHQSSTDARTAQYELGIEKLMGRPWGFGIGQGAEGLGYTNPGGILTIDTYYLLVALDYGIIGFFIYYGMFLAATGKGFLSYVGTPADADRERLLLLPAAIALANFVVIKSVFSETENHPLPFMLMAMVVALAWRARGPGTALPR